MIRLLPSFNCGVKYLLCEIDLLTKYTWIKPLRDKKATRVLQSFIETVNESNRKSNKNGLIKEENFIIVLYKIGQKMMIF